MMKILIRYSFILFSLAFLCLPTNAQESGILNALRSGNLPSSSKIVLPPSKAKTIGQNTSTNYLLSITMEQESNITDRAYPLMSAKWPFNRVYVCWENLDPVFHNERELVRSAVRETWQAYSGLKFLGWGQCKNNSVGIRISVEDRGPHVKQLGKYLDGIPNGMVLNFTYKNWSQSCQSKLDYCNRVIAVHEFGHAIGFAHEQNRPDTPGECTEQPQGTDGDTLLTPWDQNSVMNYCSEEYANDGVLSEFDILATQFIYGIE